MKGFGGTWLSMLALSLGALAACSDPVPEVRASPAAETITVSSVSIAAGQPIPRPFTCDGGGSSPALSWSGIPADAAALALVVDDPDAPNGTFTHWVVLDIPVDVLSVPAASVPGGGVEARSSAGSTAYVGPCPPSGTHHYRFTVYALSSPTGLAEGVALDTALKEIDSRVIAWGRLTATYSRG